MPRPSKIEIACCPVCKSEDIEVKGNKVYCGDCDITYKVNTQGTKPFDTNPLDKAKSRIDQLEDDVTELKGPTEPGPGPTEPGPGPTEPKSGDDEEFDENGNPKPFITW